MACKVLGGSNSCQKTSDGDIEGQHDIGRKNHVHDESY